MPPGHRAKVARARAELPRGVALAGAAVDGPGLDTAITSGLEAADRVTT